EDDVHHREEGEGLRERPDVSEERARVLQLELGAHEHEHRLEVMPPRRRLEPSRDRESPALRRCEGGYPRHVTMATCRAPRSTPCAAGRLPSARKRSASASVAQASAASRRGPGGQFFRRRYQALTTSEA